VELLKAVWRFAAMAARDYLTDDENDDRIAAEAAAQAAWATVNTDKPGADIDTDDLLYDERIPARADSAAAACERLFVLMNGPAK
jgi:hypothetical protein